MDISIISTLYRSEPFIVELVERCKAAAEKLTSDYEIILVDDGSPDNSLAVATKIAANDPHVMVVELSRNFGHHRAIMEGIAHASGQRVFLLDSDLEEPPEVLLPFDQIMSEKNCDVVYGVHGQSNGSWLRRYTSKHFWRVFGFIGTTNTPSDICNVRLMNRKYIDALLLLPENDVFLGGLFYWVGFKQVPTLVERRINRSRSTYSFVARVRLAFRAILSFSDAPLRGIFWFGTIVAILSSLVALYFIAHWMRTPTTPMGFTALIVSIWFLGGTIIACLGVLGMYLSYIFSETKSRPRTIVRKIHGRAPDG